MKKLFKMGMILIVSLAMILTSCKKEEVNSNGNNNGNTENPGGGNQEYPSSADVLYDVVTDIDGNSYDAVRIGDQIWMAENLRTTRYADGTAIPMGDTISRSQPYRYAPGSQQSNEDNMPNVSLYGYLYNWPAVMHGEPSSTADPSGVQGICPDGWHVPSDAEWTHLTTYMATQSVYIAGGASDHIAKALAANWGWSSDVESVVGTDVVGFNPGSNNASGFSALPAGYCQFLNIDYVYIDKFINFGFDAFFWTGTECFESGAYKREINHDHSIVKRGDYKYKELGFSVRCVRD